MKKEANYMKLFLNDLPLAELTWIESNCSEIAVDSETTGLHPMVDILCLVQIAACGKYFLVKITDDFKEAPNLCMLMANGKIRKVFHNANFDIRFLIKNLNCSINNIICTKISAKILNGIEAPSSLKDLVRRYLGIDLNKSQQISNWRSKLLSDDQMEYAINDVRFLLELWSVIREKLNADGKLDIAQNCFDFLPTQSRLENLGIENIFKY